MQHPMIDSFRWFGPHDSVSLAFIRQCGVEGIYTALHHVPYGEAWTREEIRTRKELIAAHGMRWNAVEPIPVSEAIKWGAADRDRHIENYCTSIRNLGAEGVKVVLNAFMPALEWLRTDLEYKLPDGKECLYYDSAHLAAFDCHLLQRPGAENDYTQDQLERAEQFLASMTKEEQDTFAQKLCRLFPGIDLQLTLDELRDRLAPYQAMTADDLKHHLRYFIEAITPVAEEAGVMLAMHPDDPPFSILGIPRILSTEQDFKDMIDMADSPSNGICFCTGSLGAREDNDCPGIVERLGHRINAVHLRNVQREPGGIFYEADHLGGSVPMPKVVQALLREQEKRQSSGRPDWQLSYRPDHGHTMLDDHAKPMPQNPGYTCIGRMRGLAELRGLQQGIIAAS